MYARQLATGMQYIAEQKLILRVRRVLPNMIIKGSYMWHSAWASQAHWLENRQWKEARNEHKITSSLQSQTLDLPGKYSTSVVMESSGRWRVLAYDQENTVHFSYRTPNQTKIWNNVVWYILGKDRVVNIQITRIGETSKILWTIGFWLPTHEDKPHDNGVQCSGTKYLLIRSQSLWETLT